MDVLTNGSTPLSRSNLLRKYMPNAPHITSTTIETVTGKFVDICNPDPSQIDIHDIAWSLSRMPRFVGHTITKIPYCIAQHCMLVAERIQKAYPTDIELILKGLLHDAAECYTSDLPSPLKNVPEIRPIIKKIEKQLDDVIFKSLNMLPITEEEHKIIKTFDKISQKIEGYAFMNSRGMYWDGMPEVSIVDLQNFEPPLSNIDAYEKFLKIFNELHAEFLRGEEHDSQRNPFEPWYNRP